MKNRNLKFLFILAVMGCTEGSKESQPVTQTVEEYHGPIIDMHIHAFDASNPLFGMTHPPTLRGVTYQGVSSASEQKTQTIAKFKEHHIVKAMVANGDLWPEEDSEVILIGGAYKEIDSLRKQHDEGDLQVMAEMAPFYQGILADDPSQTPYFALAQELGVPVGFHIFPGGPNYGLHLMPEMLGAMRTYNANPLQVEKVLVQFPHLKMYLMHGGWPYVEDVKALMYAHPNLYVDIAVLNWVLPQEEFHSYLKSLIRSGFGDRIMYGSDQMVWPEVISVGIESVNNADFLTLDQKEDIFYDNAAKFLGLSDDEIFKHKSITSKER